MILIFTNKQDVHPNNVIPYLVRWGVPIFRLNCECLLSDYEFKWWCNTEGCDFHIKNRKSGLECYGHQITAIWERRPHLIKELPIRYSDRRLNKFLRSEANEFLRFLRYYLRDIYSIGSIANDRVAASKMLQLNIARELGMCIPDTAFGNCKAAFANLCEKHDFLSLKAIDGESYYYKDDKEYVFFSRKASSKDVLQKPEESFTQTFSFLQNYVDKKYELRITVCNKDVVACKIDSQSLDDDRGKNDWRQGYDYDLKHEIVEIPEKIKDFCFAFLAKMGLNFGCFDFIVTPDNEYVFLECNPNGQWLWIEIVTGYDISKIIAKNLAKYEKFKE